VGEKQLHSLSMELNKIRVAACPFSNLPAAGRSRLDTGLTAAGCPPALYPILGPREANHGEIKRSCRSKKENVLL
jgi:hypothetical protein